MLLEDQDRSRWDADRIRAGRSQLERATTLRRLGPYQLQAAIAAEHARAPSYAATDWARIVVGYDQLLEHLPSPVVALNRAVAVAERDGPAAALELVDALLVDPRLARSHRLPATRALLLERLGRCTEARAELNRALELAPNGAERRLLSRRLAGLDPHPE